MIFCGLPLFHVNGQLVTGLMPWTHGDHVILGTPQGYRGNGVIAGFWAMVEHFGINFFSGVPTVYSALLQQPVDGRDISSLDYALCGAAPMPVELFRDFEQRIGVRILEGYSPKAPASSSNPPEGERRVGSIGLRLAYQDMRAVILDEAGLYQRDAGTDEVGAIAIRGPNVFAGYLDAAHDKGLWIDIDGQRWLNTGDLGRQDAEGYFWLTGRKKELIIRGGHNIDPKQIEEARRRTRPWPWWPPSAAPTPMPARCRWPTCSCCPAARPMPRSCWPSPQTPSPSAPPCPSASRCSTPCR